MRNMFVILTLGLILSTVCFADEARSSCERETGLPECNPGLSRAVHCCVDKSNIPNVRCRGMYYPVRGDDGRWTCGRDPGGNR